MLTAQPPTSTCLIQALQFNVLRTMRATFWPTGPFPLAIKAKLLTGLKMAPQHLVQMGAKAMSARISTAMFRVKSSNPVHGLR